MLLRILLQYAPTFSTGASLIRSHGFAPLLRIFGLRHPGRLTFGLRHLGVHLFRARSIQSLRLLRQLGRLRMSSISKLVAAALRCAGSCPRHCFALSPHTMSCTCCCSSLTRGAFGRSAARSARLRCYNQRNNPSTQRRDCL